MASRILNAVYIFAIMLIFGGLLFEIIMEGTDNHVGIWFGAFGVIYGVIALRIDARMGFPTKKSVSSRKEVRNGQ